VCGRVAELVQNNKIAIVYRQIFYNGINFETGTLLVSFDLEGQRYYESSRSSRQATLLLTRPMHVELRAWYTGISCMVGLITRDYLSRARVL